MKEVAAGLFALVIIALGFSFCLLPFIADWIIQKGRDDD